MLTPLPAEIKSICVIMIAGGLDTTPACILLGLAILSGPQGKALQGRMLDEIQQIYPDGKGWGKCLQEEKLEYVQAFCKEVLRYWTVIPMSLPRVSIKDVTYQGARIPAGTTFLMVCNQPEWQPHSNNAANRFHGRYRMHGLPILILIISSRQPPSLPNVF